MAQTSNCTLKLLTKKSALRFCYFKKIIKSLFKVTLILKSGENQTKSETREKNEHFAVEIKENLRTCFFLIQKRKVSLISFIL